MRSRQREKKKVRGKGRKTVFCNGNFGAKDRFGDVLARIRARTLLRN